MIATTDKLDLALSGFAFIAPVTMEDLAAAKQRIHEVAPGASVDVTLRDSAVEIVVELDAVRALRRRIPVTPS